MHYDVLIIGATCAALGIAQALDDRARVVIVDSGAMVAGEFVNSFRPCEHAQLKPETDAGRQVLDMLVRYDAVHEANAAFYPAGCVFCKALAQLSADILLDTQILSVEERQEGYEVSAFGCAGHMNISAAVVIDTTYNASIIKEKSLNCLLVSKDAQVPAFLNNGSIRIYALSDAQPRKAIARMVVSADTDLFAARHMLVDFLHDNAAQMSGWKVCAIALCFDVRCETPQVNTGHNRYWLPSASFSDPIAAIDGGYALGRSVNV